MEVIFLSNSEKTYYYLKLLKKLWTLPLEYVVNYQDCQTPGLSQRIDKMANLGQSFSQKEVTQPKDVNNLSRLLVQSSPAVGASRSFANVAKSGSQDKVTSTIEVEIYNERVLNNVYKPVVPKQAHQKKHSLLKTSLVFQGMKCRASPSQLAKGLAWDSSSMSQSMFRRDLQAKTCYKYQGQMEMGRQAFYGAKFWESAMKSQKNPQPLWSSATLTLKNPKSGNLMYTLVKWYQKQKKLFLVKMDPRHFLECAQEEETTKLKFGSVKDPQAWWQLKETIHVTIALDVDTQPVLARRKKKFSSQATRVSTQKQIHHAKLRT